MLFCQNAADSIHMYIVTRLFHGSTQPSKTFSHSEFVNIVSGVLTGMLTYASGGHFCSPSQAVS